MPPESFEIAFSIRIFRVSAFLPDVTQQIHSLRASGVMSRHVACARGEDVSAFWRSDGRTWTAPIEISFLAMKLFSSHRSRNNQRIKIRVAIIVILTFCYFKFRYNPICQWCENGFNRNFDEPAGND